MSVPGILSHLGLWKLASSGLRSDLPAPRHELVTPLTQPSILFPTACGCDLAEGGFFVRQGEHICTRDYQRLYGTRCFSCDRFIEGEVVSALGKTYHPDCFVCAVCR